MVYDQKYIIKTKKRGLESNINYEVKMNLTKLKLFTHGFINKEGLENIQTILIVLVFIGVSIFLVNWILKMYDSN